MAHAWMRHVTLLCACLLLLGVLSSPALAGPEPSKHYCESRNGTVIAQKGSARCTTDATSYAKASGRHAVAEAFNGGSASATGVGSYAAAGDTGPPGGTAIAIGDGSYAVAGTNATAIADGNGAYAAAQSSYSSAVGTNSRALSVDPGSIAKARGTNSDATAVSGGHAGANGLNSFAQAGGTNSEAVADGDNSSATASGACYVYAGPGETQTCSGPLY